MKTLNKTWKKAKTAARWLEGRACVDDARAVRAWMESDAFKKNGAAVLAYKGSDDFLALHFAARHGAGAVAALLLEAGTDPWAKDAYGKMPHHYAELYHHTAVLAALPPAEDEPTKAAERAKQAAAQVAAQAKAVEEEARGKAAQAEAEALLEANIDFAPPADAAAASVPLQGLDTSELFNGLDPRPIWDVYEQKDILGTGAFGTVFRAQNKSTGQVCAVKQVLKAVDAAASAGDGGDSRAEFVMCSRISHPHVLRVLCYFDTPQALFIVSELAAGGELRDFLCAQPELNTETGIACVISQALAALIHLHTAKIIHHDVKPANILVTAEKWDRDPTGATPVVVLADFGTSELRRQAGALRRVRTFKASAAGEAGSAASAELASHAAANADSVDEVELLGTPEYCGPEVFGGESGPRTDVYALGITIFELLSGEKPFAVDWGDMFADDFDANDTTARYAQMTDLALEADFSMLKGASADGVALLRKMLQKQYALRPSARECSETAWFERAASGAGYFAHEQKSGEA
eukprot:1226264-Prymnesium_polylepis.1